ncbi:MAG TPA: glycine cleavage system aminomethyltransferase GcvT [Acidimicrobiales bacterium]|nr:glycine cleavage system aminomethyltransferase GcvT [Acidimicrobiales bacterium]
MIVHQGGRSSPLEACHEALGARMVDFGGWRMPLSYPAGTVAEHLACRSSAAAFDVSHLGTVRVSGPDAYGRLNSVLTNDLARIGSGRAQYTHLLDEDASVMDDLIVWWRDEQVFDVMPNASNTDAVVAAIGGVDVTADRAVIAVQGPAARRLIAGLAAEAADVARFGVTGFEWKGESCIAAGTGYTGEDGVECAVPVPVAPLFWDAVIGAGACPAGLGARDTLRLEAGLPLHGHELGPGITPLQAGLGWVVAWSKPAFRGRAALEAERATGPSRVLRGLVVEGRRPPRHGCPVHKGPDGVKVGVVTSGNFSPVLGSGIGLALLPPDVATGDRLDVDIRGRRVPAIVVELPFVPRPAA